MEILIYFIILIIALLLWAYTIYISDECDFIDIVIFFIILVLPYVYIIGFILSITIIILLKLFEKNKNNVYNKIKKIIQTPLWKKK